MIQLYSNDESLLLRLRILSVECIHIEDINELDSKKITLCDKESGYKLAYARDDIKILILSAHPKYEEGKELLTLGVRGYANKYIHKKHLLQAVEVIKGGNIWLYPDFMSSMISDVTTDKQPNEAVLKDLTEREKETALLIAEGYSNKEIAQKLNITERTVKAHLTSIYTKTNLPDRLSLAKNIFS